MRLLLVEDQPEIQSFLKQPLANAGYEVNAAKDGRTAIQLASGKKYDVLIVDLGLPDQPDAGLLHRVIANLLDNHLPASCTVSIKLGASEDAAILIVEDDGPGLLRRLASTCSSRG